MGQYEIGSVKSFTVGEKKINLNVEEELTEDQKLIVKSYLRKIDIRVVPIMIILYLFGLIDRGNIGAAIVNGLRDGLHLTSSEEGTATTIFYILYIVFETPSNMLLKKFRPHIWFALIGSCWAGACISLAFAKNGTNFIVSRALLGAFEAGFTPGVVGYLNYWYTRSEVGKRMTIPISGMIGSPMSAGLASAKLHTFKPYQVIFLIEGCLTLFFCLLSFFIIQDYPDEAKFLTPEEHELCIRRLVAEQGMASKTNNSLKNVLNVIADWKVWVFALIFFGFNNIAIMTGVFSPVIIKTMGFTGVTSTYFASLQSAGGFVGTLVAFYYVNKVPYFILLSIYGFISVIGYGIMAFAKGTALRLFALTLAGFGLNPTVVLALTWSSINQSGIYKGLIASAMIISFGTIPGATVPRLFVAKYSPDYIAAHSIILGFTALSGLLSFILGMYFKKENARRDNNPVDLSHLSEFDQREMFNDHPNFRFRR
ncbi:hypothetical protein BB559_004820 [Furculomyces boomerangus]|uniref:Major facilitator superfamily (MFS) profile domain-containing protein n=1 Tax=Furculomyces boomerangus TaxID=61424 RepID=A0A2T9YCK9_9FUNG|nr:hypothetical protein BB559_004820 [Furculomyces boomerangus]